MVHWFPIFSADSTPELQRQGTACGTRVALCSNEKHFLRPSPGKLLSFFTTSPQNAGLPTVRKLHQLGRVARCATALYLIVSILRRLKWKVPTRPTSAGALPPRCPPAGVNNPAPQAMCCSPAQFLATHFCLFRSLSHLPALAF